MVPGSQPLLPRLLGILQMNFNELSGTRALMLVPQANGMAKLMERSPKVPTTRPKVESTFIIAPVANVGVAAFPTGPEGHCAVILLLTLLERDTSLGLPMLHRFHKCFSSRLFDAFFPKVFDNPSRPQFPFAATWVVTIEISAAGGVDCEHCRLLLRKQQYVTFPNRLAMVASRIATFLTWARRLEVLSNWTPIHIRWHAEIRHQCRRRRRRRRSDKKNRRDSIQVCVMAVFRFRLVRCFSSAHSHLNHARAHPAAIIAAPTIRIAAHLALKLWSPSSTRYQQASTKKRQPHRGP
mmetsp:Transcript_105651/g.209907  ORF Transcript_105651/g.209907 Transcript_105651/m.209907 type:complete len:295 (-) Transcript_105651:46-930(-)